MVFTLSVVASVVTVLAAAVTVEDPGHMVQLAITLPVLVVLVAGSWLLRIGDRPHRPAWAVFPFLCLLVLVGLDLLTGDATMAAQVFLLFPALYASSQLRRHAALAVTAAAVAGDAVVVFTLLPVRLAATDAVYMSAAIATCAALLAAAAGRREVVLDQLRRHAALDPLTGLVTRRVLESAAQTALSGALERAGTALILIDVDRFKSINDTHGHLAGDEVLVQVAGILLNLSRPEDTVSRLGGDEIALLLPACSAQVASVRAEAVRATIAAHVFVLPNGHHARLSVSAGVAHAAPHGDSLRALYSRADAALYQAKNNGRDRVVAAGPTVLSPPASIVGDAVR